MYKYVTILEGQSVWDLAVQHFGSVEGLPQLLTDNPELNLQDSPAAGTLVKIDLSKVVDKDVVSYLKEKNAHPGNGVSVLPTAFSAGFNIGFK